VIEAMKMEMRVSAQAAGQSPPSAYCPASRSNPAPYWSRSNLKTSRRHDAIDKAILTCALTGVLTDPKQHPVPVTPQQMAASAREAYDAGATIMHVHLRQQAPAKGHLPSWDPEVAAEPSSTRSAPPAPASSST
jgi:hypothetical protein